MRPIQITVAGNTEKDFLLDVYTTTQNVRWNINGGTVAVHGLVGPQDALVEEPTALTGSNFSDEAYTALRFKNTDAADSIVTINQTGSLS